MKLIKTSHLAPLCFLLLNGVGEALLLTVLDSGDLLLLLLIHGSRSDVLSVASLVVPMVYGVAWLLVILTRNPPPPWQWWIIKGCGTEDHSQRAPPLDRMGMPITADTRKQRWGDASQDKTLPLCFKEEGGGQINRLVLLFFFLFLFRTFFF